MQGETIVYGSRDAFRLAFKRGLIENGETWMDMVRSRILTTHTYNEEVAEQIVAAIINCYYSEFLQLHAKMQTLKEENC